MTRRTKIVYAKIAVILAALPVLVYAHYFGPDPGFTAAPGDNPKACISSGCHVGTVNSGPGNVKITLPAGNSGTYVPGQAMQILVQITDSTKSSYGFQLTARMGGGNTTQAGDFITTDANTQVLCADSTIKANGSVCKAPFSVEDIEHTDTGYLASLKASPKGSFTYSFNWTPPSTASGPVTMYVAANCGTGTMSSSPTNVYTSSIALTPATSGPTMTNVLDAESARASITSGQWVAIYGSSLANTTRFWGNSDFTGGLATGSPLPTVLDGVSVKIGSQPAAVYFVSPTQLNVQAPSNLTLGSVPVVVTNNGAVSSSFTATVVQSSPSFFYYGAGGKLFPLAVHLNGKLIGDPAISGGNVEKAHPGETIEFFMNGLAASTGGSIVPVTGYSPSPPITVSAGSNALAVGGAAIIFAGEYQVNVTLPANIATGDYTLTMTVPNGSTSTAGVTYILPVGP